MASRLPLVEQCAEYAGVAGLIRTTCEISRTGVGEGKRVVVESAGGLIAVQKRLLPQV
jgi:hypothetical protein